MRQRRDSIDIDLANYDKLTAQLQALQEQIAANKPELDDKLRQRQKEENEALGAVARTMLDDLDLKKRFIQRAGDLFPVGSRKPRARIMRRHLERVLGSLPNGGEPLSTTKNYTSTAKADPAAGRT